MYRPTLYKYKNMFYYYNIYLDGYANILMFSDYTNNTVLYTVLIYNHYHNIIL